MVSKAIKYVTTITYRWALGWQRQPWVGWWLENGGVGPKLRPETSNSTGMGDSWWNERCLYY